MNTPPVLAGIRREFLRHALTDDSAPAGFLSIENKWRPRRGRPKREGSLVNRRSLPVIAGSAASDSGAGQSGSGPAGTWLSTAPATSLLPTAQRDVPTNNVFDHRMKMRPEVVSQRRCGRVCCESDELRDKIGPDSGHGLLVGLPELGIFSGFQQLA